MYVSSFVTKKKKNVYTSIWLLIVVKTFINIFFTNMPSPLCVVNVYSSKKGILKHRFPIKDPPRFLTWIKRSGNKKLINMTHEQIYKSYVMCDLHFVSSCHSLETKRLKHNSVPTLLLPERKLICT